MPPRRLDLIETIGFTSAYSEASGLAEHDAPVVAFDIEERFRAQPGADGDVAEQLWTAGRGDAIRGRLLSATASGLSGAGEQRRERGRAVAGSATEPPQSEEVFDSLEDGVVVGGCVEAGMVAYGTAGDDRDYVSACGESAAPVIARAFVPGQKQQPPRAQRVDQRRDQVRQEPVAGSGVAVVHVVADVRGDPHEGG